MRYQPLQIDANASVIHSLVTAIWDCSKNWAFKKHNQVGPMFPAVSWVNSVVQYQWRLGQNGRMKW